VIRVPERRGRSARGRSAALIEGVRPRAPRVSPCTPSTGCVGRLRVRELRRPLRTARHGLGVHPDVRLVVITAAGSGDGRAAHRCEGQVEVGLRAVTRPVCTDAPRVGPCARSTGRVRGERARERRRSFRPAQHGLGGDAAALLGPITGAVAPPMATSHTQHALHTGQTTPALCEVHARCVRLLGPAPASPPRSLISSVGPPSVAPRARRAGPRARPCCTAPQNARRHRRLGQCLEGRATPVEVLAREAAGARPG
jgi:hypothetical protein